MALSFSTTARNAMLDALNTDINTGTGNPLIRIYDGTRPAAGGTATTLLAELTASDPFAPAASAGALTASAITQDSLANASGTATWFRIVRGDGTTWSVDGSVTVTGGGGDMQLVTTTITINQPVQVSSCVLTLTSQA